MTTYNPSIFEAVDPGVGYRGAAFFAHGELASARFSKEDIAYFGPACGFVIVELPQIYTSGLSKKEAIRDLAVAAGEIGGLYPFRRYVTPAEWNGQLKAPIRQARTLKALSAAERKILSALGLPQTKLAHVLSAVGIGLWQLGRS